MGHRPRSGILGDREYPGDREDGDGAVPPARPTPGPFSGGAAAHEVLTFGGWRRSSAGHAEEPRRWLGVPSRTVIRHRVSPKGSAFEDRGPPGRRSFDWGSMMMRQLAAPASAIGAYRGRCTTHCVVAFRLLPGGKWPRAGAAGIPHHGDDGALTRVHGVGGRGRLASTSSSS